MNTTLRVIVCTITWLTIVGCTGYRDTVRGIGHNVGGIQTRDIQRADAYREALPRHLGLSPDQIRVEPGSTSIIVTVLRVNSDVQRKTITDAISALNFQNPGLNPLNVRFK